jgi:transposase
MFYGVTSGIPVYYQTYAGSIPDTVCLEYMLICAKDLGITDTNFVFDCCFVTEDNFNYMFNHNIPFTTAMPGNRDIAEELINAAKTEIEKSENMIRKYNVYGIKRQITLYGHKIQAHIYFDPKRRALEIENVYKHIDKLEAELNKISKSNQITKRFKDIFDIDEQSKSKFSFEISYTKIDKKLIRAGYFILLNTNDKASCEDTLEVYRKKDCVEKGFNNFKNGLGGDNTRVHSSKAWEGKMFVTFIALIMRTSLKIY